MSNEKISSDRKTLGKVALAATLSAAVFVGIRNARESSSQDAFSAQRGGIRGAIQDTLCYYTGAVGPWNKFTYFSREYKAEAKRLFQEWEERQSDFSEEERRLMEDKLCTAAWNIVLMDDLRSGSKDPFDEQLAREICQDAAPVLLARFKEEILSTQQSSSYEKTLTHHPEILELLSEMPTTDIHADIHNPTYQPFLHDFLGIYIERQYAFELLHRASKLTISPEMQEEIDNIRNMAAAIEKRCLEKTVSPKG